MVEIETKIHLDKIGILEYLGFLTDSISSGALCSKDEIVLDRLVSLGNMTLV